MDLQREISESLWLAISGTYSAGNYSHAVTDAFQFLTRTLRERSGLDGDGAQLLGQALGGESPKLKITPMQTESERNVQKGIEQMLRGLYQGIRNPRSHDSNIDSKQDADAILVFLDYLVGLVDSSEESFTLDILRDRITDPEFVESKRYAELLLQEIPALRRLDALKMILDDRRQLTLKRLRHLVAQLLKSLNAAQVGQYLQLVGDELRTAPDDVSIRTALQLVRPNLWPQLSEIARLRIEHKILNGLRSGEVLSSGKTTEPLATWARGFLVFFSNRIAVENVLVAKLEDSDRDDRKYVVRYFFSELPVVVQSENNVKRCISAIAKAILAGEEDVKSALILHIDTFPNSWQDLFSELLSELVDPNNPAVKLYDGRPFLSEPSVDDDIPF